MNIEKLSIIIPVFNEEKTIQKTIERVFRADTDGIRREIIVINDGSTDNSYNILKDLMNKFSFVFISHPKNLGKGSALRTGFQRTSGDIIIVQDADLEYNPSDFSKILRAFENKKVMVVYGSRNIHPKKRGYPHYVLGAWFLTFLINRLFKSRLTDSYTCYKAFRREVIKSLELDSTGFEIEAEITAKILKKRIRIKEVPISYSPRKFKEGKKIGLKDAFKGMSVIFKNYFSNN
ncbi:MAG TPA: glycosyltransferase family 2 protein [Candidatus Moranbacteria bacterium]|nr:glycosyltransferase family 2 protein [Candidatus Moranbacteria bacterium]